MKLTGKRALSLLLSLALLLTLVPAVALTASADDVVATVTSGGTATDYTSYADAMNAWVDGSTLTLQSDVTTSGYKLISSGRSLTLDLNGHTITASSTYGALVTYGGSLTVTDSSAGQTGRITGSVMSVYHAAGSLTLNGGTIGSASQAFGIYAADGAIVVNGGSVLGSDTAIYGYMDDETTGPDGTASVTVHDGVIGSAGSEHGIYGEFSAVTVDGGSITATDCALGAFAGTVDFSDGNINYTGTASALQLGESVTATISGGTITSSGNGIYIGDFANPTTGAKVLNVTGGTITAARYAIASNGATVENITVNISGGSLTGTSAGLYIPNQGETVNISGDATITGNTGIAVKGGTVNIAADAAITATGAKQDPAENTSGFTGTGDALYVEDTYGAAYAPTVIITGGSFTSANGYAMQYYSSKTDAADATGYIEASGGTFASPQATSERNSSALDDKIILSGGVYDAEPTQDDLAPGKIAVQLESGKWTISSSYIKGYSLSLKGDIAVNYFFDLGGLDATQTSVVFSWCGQTATYRFSELRLDASGYYKIPIKVAAKQMTDTITTEIKQGDTVLERNEYSVATYARRVYNNADGEFDSYAHLEELRALCLSMLIYGAKAQTQFNYNTAAPADAGLDNTQAAVDASTLGSYGTADLSPFGLAFTDSSLFLQSTTTHRLYFTVTDAGLTSGVTVTCGNKTLTLVVEGATAYVDIPDIAARNVLKNYTVTFAKGTDTAKLTVNAGAYIANALGAGNETLAGTVTALYWYSTAAEAYFKAN